MRHIFFSNCFLICVFFSYQITLVILVLKLTMSVSNGGKFKCVCQVISYPTNLVCLRLRKLQITSLVRVLYKAYRSTQYVNKKWRSFSPISTKIREKETDILLFISYLQSFRAIGKPAPCLSSFNSSASERNRNSANEIIVVYGKKRGKITT